MSKIAYVKKRFSNSSMEMIVEADEIVDEYQKQGFSLTLRQLYYQFVSRDLLENNQKEYKRLGSVINDARLAGYIDWESIEDRTRELRALAHWESPADIVAACAKQFRVDKWAPQAHYVEVWIEKDALVGVIEGVCKSLDVPYFSCRGYTSQSEMWSAGQRLVTRCEAEKEIHIIHLGDHDPSGIDMSRDIEDRLNLFLEHEGYQIDGEVNRIALNMDQVQQYAPPPNPAKLTDSRSEDYVEKYGEESWELDALDPKTLAALIKNTIMGYIDDDIWQDSVDEERAGRQKLEEIAAELKTE